MAFLTGKCGRMVIEIADDFDLKKIADSGQCFRWTEVAEGYQIIAGDHLLRIRECQQTEDRSVRIEEVRADRKERGEGNREDQENGKKRGESTRGLEEGFLKLEQGSGENGDDRKEEAGCFELSCSVEEFESFWKRYFDLDLDYSAVRQRIDPEKDPYLYRASVCGRGIRILNQDPWETLVTFIISQRKNIPAIRLSVEKLCRMAGTQLAEGIYSFPAPEQLCLLSEEQLAACSLGYRAKYVHRAAEDAADGRIDFRGLAALPDDALKRELMKLYGVGIKVANCEMLFGFHRLDSFPEDVWILRLLQEAYPKGFPFDEYRPYNGIMQQYLFWYRRTVTPLAGA